MARQDKRIYEFGDFRIDTVNRRLTRDGEAVPLKQKAVDALLVLIENKGDVVEKDELMSALWADSFVEESNLTQHIYTLRKAFGGSEFIETVPRRGYRFIGDVREVEGADADVIVVREQRRVTVSYEEDDGRPEPLQLPPAQGRRWWPLAVALVLMIVCVAAFLWLRRQQAARFENARLAKLTTTGNVVRAAISPDGKYLAFVTNDRGAQGLWLRQIATGKDIAINQPENTDYYGLTFMHDGTYLYFVDQAMNRPGVLFRVAVLGGTPDKLVEDVDSPVTIAPDDKHIAYFRVAKDEHAIVAADADGTHERKIAASRKEDDYVIAPMLGVVPAWSADGKTIACVVGRQSSEGNYESIWGFDAESGSPRPLTDVRWEAVGRMEWLPGTNELVTTAAEEGSGFAQQIWHIAPSGATRKVTNDLNDYRDLSLARDGKTIVAVQAERKANVFVAAMNDLDHPRQITATNYDGLNGMAWTHDDRVIYTHRTTGEQNLWAVNASGAGDPKRLTSHEGFIIDPSVSADDRFVIFAASTRGQSHIFRADVDGRNMTELTHGASDVEPAFLPDGDVAYRPQIPGTPGINKVAVNGGEPRLFIDKRVFGLIASPDGGTLGFGFRSEPAERNMFVVMPAAGGEIRIVSEFPAHYGRFMWMPDGTALAYADRQNPLGNIWAQPIDGGPPWQVTFWLPAPIYSFAFSPDGKKLAAAIGSQTSDAISIGDRLN